MDTGWEKSVPCVPVELLKSACGLPVPLSSSTLGIQKKKKNLALKGKSLFWDFFHVCQILACSGNLLRFFMCFMASEQTGIFFFNQFLVHRKLECCWSDYHISSACLFPSVSILQGGLCEIQRFYPCTRSGVSPAEFSKLPNDDPNCPSRRKPRH